jgi:hypothetical protein
VYRAVSAEQLRGGTDRLVVLDADRVLHAVQGGNSDNLDYFAVGMPARSTWQP